MRFCKEKIYTEQKLIQDCVEDDSQFSDFLESSARDWLSHMEEYTDKQLEDIRNFSRLTVFELVASESKGGLVCFVDACRYDFLDKQIRELIESNRIVF